MKTSIVRKQRGALGLMMAMIMLVLVLFAALAIDMARLTYQQQALQSVADIAALEVSKENPYYIDPTNSSGIESELRGKYFAEGKIDSGELGLKVVSGSAAIKDNYWTFSESPYSDERPYSAAQVKVTKTVPKSMIAGGLFNGETVTLTATAAIQKSGVVRFGIGSELISAKLSGVDLSVGSYEGLVKGNIRLNDVISVLPNVDLTTMTPEQVLNTEISASALLGAYADVLRLNHDDEGYITVLNEQLLKIKDLVKEVDITLGELVSLSNTQMSAALGASLNALDLVKATLYAANKNNGLSIPAVGINIPGVSSITTEATLIEPPKFNIAFLPIKKGDKPSVKTSQLNAKLTAQLDLLNTVEELIKILGLTIDVAPLNLDLTGGYAKATIVSGDNTSVMIKLERVLTEIQVDPLTIKISLKPLGIPLPVKIGLNTKIMVEIEPDLEPRYEFFLADLENNKHLFSYSDTKFKPTVTISYSGILGVIIKPIVESLVQILEPLLESIISDLLTKILLPTLSSVGVVSLGDTIVWVDVAGTSQYGIIK